jgi:hypothetical protein
MGVIQIAVTQVVVISTAVHWTVAIQAAVVQTAVT